MSDGDKPAGAGSIDRASQWIVFTLDQTEYLLRSAQIAQIEMVEKITPVPNAPVFVKGIAYYRGEVVPVMDLRARLGMAPAEIGPASRVIVVESVRRRIGLLVDRAREVLYAGEGEVLPTPETATGGHASQVEGVVIRDKRLLLVLALEAVLQTETSLLPLDVVSSLAGETAARVAESSQDEQPR
jgi:purine-binding chemotaxis protein CheW